MEETCPRIFIAPGNRLSLKIDGLKFKEIQVEGEGAEASNYLVQKYLAQEEYKKSFDVVSFYSAEEENFIQNVEEKFSQDLSLLNQQRNLSEEFKLLEKENIRYAKLMNYMSYPEGHKYFTKQTDFEPGPAIKDALEAVDFDKERDFLNFESYRNLVVNHYSLMAREPSQFDDLENAVKSLSSPSIKKAVLNNLSFFISPSNENLDRVAKLIMSESNDQELIDKISAEYESMKNLAKGKPSPSFEYESVHGEQIFTFEFKRQIGLYRCVGHVVWTV